MHKTSTLDEGKMWKGYHVTSFLPGVMERREPRAIVGLSTSCVGTLVPFSDHTIALREAAEMSMSH
jgi:hypothetical protein